LSHSYRLLTSDGDLDARVDIHMENPEFPCEAGLYYNPTPPGKRFVYDLDQLSGGEKSIASLALHYSIAVASKSPLLVLD
jgi:structural maintenance of chromosome 1